MQKNQIREETHESMRKATSLSKQAILLSHQKKWTEAESFIENAKEKISSLQDLAETIPRLFTEACLVQRCRNILKHAYFWTLVKESRFVTPAEINVPSVDYVLGLADVIGEYRRLALDNLREGEVKKAKNAWR